MAGLQDGRDIVKLIGGNRTPKSKVYSQTISNGTELVKVLRPYGEGDLSSRVKIVWRGAGVRGRDRMARWDGGLRVLGNSILDATPINFWNILRPLERTGNQDSPGNQQLPVAWLE